MSTEQSQYEAEVAAVKQWWKVCSSSVPSLPILISPPTYRTLDLHE
jgi:hypothetical protein